MDIVRVKIPIHLVLVFAIVPSTFFFPRLIVTLQVCWQSVRFVRIAFRYQNIERLTKYGTVNCLLTDLRLDFVGAIHQYYLHRQWNGWQKKNNVKIHIIV